MAATVLEAAITEAAAEAGPEEDTSGQVRLLLDRNVALESQVMRLRDQREIIREATRSCLAALEPGMPRLTEVRADTTGKCAEVAHTIWSDWHIGEKVRGADTNGLGKFNWDICQARMDTLFLKTQLLLDFHRKYAKIEDLYINVLGDIWTGEGIFHKQAHRIDLTLRRQFHLGVRRVSELVRDLACEVERVHVHLVPGNHDQPLGHRGDLADDASLIGYDQIEHELSGIPNVDIQTWESSIAEYQDAAGKWILAAHGNQFKTTLRVPMYGYGRWVGEQMEHFGRHFNCSMIGHWHSPTVARRERCWMFVNGCLPGPTEYSHKMGRGGTPGQWLFAHADGVESPAWMRNIDVTVGAPPPDRAAEAA
ncbi:MAG: hypothetical protein GF320_14310 [Armatimonadia bacterium]|nr:hypothetical protein [Armatimonadia bacterium]